MVVAIAGAHGKIAMQLIALLQAHGEQAIGLIRNPEHADDVGREGATPVVCDLERAAVDELADAIAGADAAVFAAGAGPGSGAARKLTMDRDGAIKLLDAARASRVRRYLIVSSVGAENPPGDDDVFSVYLRAKAEADRAVMASDRDWTIVRPGRLTDEPGTGRVRIDAAPFSGRVPREDVAAVLARLLQDPRAPHRLLYVNGGSQPIERALEEILAEPASR
ncbi:MAG: SDR family oxidoreductase [Solirubrobacterales bacterium]|nr:SDR family oxidoreductase [Solirubrobacterales bacterium]